MKPWSEKARAYQKRTREIDTRQQAVELVNEIITDHAEGQISNGEFQTLITLCYWKALLTLDEYMNIKKGLGA